MFALAVAPNLEWKTFAVRGIRANETFTIVKKTLDAGVLRKADNQSACPFVS